MRALIEKTDLQREVRAGRGNAPIYSIKRVQNCHLLDTKKRVQNCPKKGTKLYPKYRTTDFNSKTIKDVVLKNNINNQTKPNLFKKFEDFSAFVLALPTATEDIRRRYIEYHKERTFWKTMSAEDVAANLQKWADTEYPKNARKGAKSAVCAVKTYEEYYSTFGTTMPQNGWKMQRTEDGLVYIHD